MMVLYVEIKNVYGNELIYPRLPVAASEAILKLTGKKTIDAQDIANLNILGITVKPKLFTSAEGRS